MAERSVSFALDNSVRNFGYKDYNDFLNSEYWQEFKEAYQHSPNPQNCLCCNSSRYQLHHISYKRICREEPEDVIPLCRHCHELVHEVHRQYHIPLYAYKQAIQVVKTGVPPPVRIPKVKKKTAKADARTKARMAKKQRAEARRRERKAVRTIQKNAVPGRLLVKCGKCSREAIQDGPYCCMCGTYCGVTQRF